MVLCQPEMVSVVYPAEREGLREAYTEALVAAGLKRGTDASGRDMVSITFLEPRHVVALGIAPIDGKQIVALTRSPR